MTTRMDSIKIKKFLKRYMKTPEPGVGHAKLSASGSERWLGCPGSIKLSQGIEQPDNEYSIAGTHAHTLLQFILENPHSWDWLLKQSESQAFRDFIDYSSTQLNGVLTAVAYVWAEHDRMWKRTGIKPTMLIEQKLELEGVGYGTSDIILYQPFGLLHVIDFKNGKSVVEPEENTQGLYYGCGGVDLFGWDVSEVWITIIQPNAPHKRGPIRTWKTSVQRIEEAGKHFRRGAYRTKLNNAPLVMDAKYCWFCPARIKCPLQLKEKSKKIMGRFER